MVAETEPPVYLALPDQLLLHHPEQFIGSS